MKPLTLTLFAASLASLALVGCNRGGGENLATVNNEEISMDEFHKYLERKPVVQVLGEDGQPKELPVVASLGFQGMRDLINRRILLQVAKDEGVLPTKADVEAELAFQTKRRQDFVAQLKAQGITLEEIKRDLTLDLAKERIVTKGITVTKADADKFIEEHPENFMSPEQAKIRLVVVKDPAKKAQVDKALASGQTFGQVAATFSDDPNARKSQGQYGVTEVRRMPDLVKEVVASTPELKTSDWKQVGEDWVKFYVERKEKAKKMPIDDTMKEAVRRGIAMDKGNAAVDLAKRLVDKLRVAKVDVKPAALKTRWEEAFKTLQETTAAPTTPTGTAPGTTPAAPPATTAGG